MNVREINRYLAAGDIEREDILPHLSEYQQRSLPLPFEFGLRELPEQPGILSIRGPRQYGKSTWLELQIEDTIKGFGPGSVFYLNGDELLNHEELFREIATLTESFAKNAKVHRIFIDEITSIKDWELALKRAADQRIIKDVLIVTTGSKALDLRRGHERLPGRKGKLSKTEYFFLPCSFRAYYANVYRELGSRDAWKYYLLSGGSPLACNEMYHTERLPDFVPQIIRDWILGEVVATGRNRMMLTSILRCLYRYGGNSVGFAKLARESGLANNTVASGYMEQLADLMCVLPSWPMDTSRDVIDMKKPCKFPFVNLSVAIAFHPNAPRQIHELKAMSDKEQSILLEWLVAQELWRRRVLKGVENPEALVFWRSKHHELDFIDENENFVEVKAGQASATEFAWFPKVFPGKRLTVICSTPFETKSVVGMTIHQFLFRDPYFKAYVTEEPEEYEVDRI